jgi:hypothetical protein
LRVRLAGNQNDVARWFAALDVFALPSYANKCRRHCYGDAMALPCVTTDAGRLASHNRRSRRSSS